MRPASQPHLRSRRALSGLLAGLLVVTPPSWATAAPKYKPLDVVTTAAKLRSGYATRDPQVYRTAMFEALVVMREASPTEAKRIAMGVIAEIKKGKADGLEPLLLAAMDLAATRADAETRASVRDAISSLSRVKVFTGGLMPPNLKTPLGRASSYLVLNVRSDAMRALYNRAIARASASTDLRSLPDLLTDTTTANAFCALPAQKNQLGVIASADAKRQASCSASGMPGGAGTNGVSGALGDLTDSGCVLGDKNAAAALEQRLQAIDQCMNEQFGGGDPAAFGPGVAILVAVAAGLIVLAADKAYNALLDDYKATKEFTRAVGELTNAVDKYTKAVAEVVSATDDVIAARKGVETAQQNTEQARQAAREAAVTGTAEEARAAAEALDKAKQDEQAAKDKLAEAQKNLGDAKKTAKDAEDKAVKAADNAEAKKPSGGLDPSDAFKSPACQAALGVPTDRVLRDRLGNDWKDWTSHLKRVSNPNPEGPSPYDSLTTPLCGGDQATIGTPQVACKVAVECNMTAMPDASCGCSGTPTDSSRLVQTASALACRNFYCQDPSAPTARASGRGVVCSCESAAGGDGGSGAGPRGPVDPRPSPVVIDTLFTPSTRASSANPSVDVVRSLFDGYSRR